jgi:hypothetical protein
MKELLDDPAVYQERVDRMFERLENALRRYGQLLPVSAEQLSVSPMCEDVPRNASSQSRDPDQLLKRGQYLLKNPHRLVFGQVNGGETVMALMEAARNGAQISPSVRQAMLADRQRSEVKSSEE